MMYPPPGHWRRSGSHYGTRAAGTGSRAPCAGYLARRSQGHPVHWVNPPRCPAQQAHGIDIAGAHFELVAENCAHEEGSGDLIEIIGYFCQRGGEFDDDEHLNDALVTAVLHVPQTSMMAFIAYRVTSCPSRALISKVEQTLRANIARCPCTAQSQCPALNQDSLTQALEHAID